MFSVKEEVEIETIYYNKFLWICLKNLLGIQ